MPKRAVALVADLMFSSRIEATLGPAGYDVEVVEELDALEAALDHDGVALVILDLHAGVAAGDVVALCLTAGGVPVLAFGRHTEPALLRAARAAGCVEVVPRSIFVEEMTRLAQRVSETKAATS